jgi:uncharacterized membrane protein YebE (DUF533 family)
MHDQDMAILRALVPVAWADGKFADNEKQMLDALLDAFGASDEEKQSLRAYAAEPKTLGDIDLSTLSAGDRRLLLQHAVVLSFADGKQVSEEQAFLKQLADHLRIPAEEAQQLIAAATARAKAHIELLK